MVMVSAVADSSRAMRSLRMGVPPVAARVDGRDGPQWNPSRVGCQAMINRCAGLDARRRERPMPQARKVMRGPLLAVGVACALVVLGLAVIARLSPYLALDASLE